MPKPSQNPVIKLLKIFSVIVVFMIFVVFVGRMSLITVRFPEPAAGSAFAPAAPRESVTVSLSEYGGVYHVKYQKVKASSGDSQNFYNLDLDVETSSKDTAEALAANKSLAVRAIRDVVEVFSFEDSKTQEGKIHMKERIKQNLSRSFGTEGISDINFENFCLNKDECTAPF